MTKKAPPEPPAVLWSLVTTAQGGRFPIRPVWYRVLGGTPGDMHAALADRTAFAEQHGLGSQFEVTERGADGRCPKPAP